MSKLSKGVYVTFGDFMWFLVNLDSQIGFAYWINKEEALSQGVKMIPHSILWYVAELIRGAKSTTGLKGGVSHLSALSFIHPQRVNTLLK